MGLFVFHRVRPDTVHLRLWLAGRTVGFGGMNVKPRSTVSDSCVAARASSRWDGNPRACNPTEEREPAMC